jgi:hypothetical protein
MSIESAAQLLTSQKTNFRPGTVSVASRHYGWLISYFNQKGKANL